MDAKQIRFFLEIARTGSFTSAAKKLFISVPGLVKSMDKLEDELGAPLFVRQRMGVCLSPAGRALEQMAPAYLRQTETIRAEVIKAACDRDAQAEVCMTWGLLSFFPAEFSFPVCAGSSQNQPVYAQRYDRRMLCARGQRQIGHRAGFSAR